VLPVLSVILVLKVPARVAQEEAGNLGKEVVEHTRLGWGETLGAAVDRGCAHNGVGQVNSTVDLAEEELCLFAI